MNFYSRIATAVMTAAALCIAPHASAQETSGLVIDGSTTVGPIASAFAEYAMSKNPEVNISVSMSGSGNGVRSLINGEAQVAAASRFMKDNEFQAAIDNGVNPTAHVVALDGLAVVVHPSNPVDALAKEQVRQIYNGEVTNWSALGGPDLEIVIISRDTNSGTYETFENLVMDGDAISQGAEYVGSNGAVRSRVQETPAAIGYVGLGFLDETLVGLEIDGVYPEAETVVTGEYPIARPLYLFTDGYPELGTPLHKFVTIHLTPDGQEMVESIGFIPVTRY